MCLYHTWIFTICKFLPFGRFFGWKGTNFTRKSKIQVYITGEETNYQGEMITDFFLLFLELGFQCMQPATFDGETVSQIQVWNVA